MDKGKTRNLIRGILLILGSFFCIGVTSFFIVKLFVYGLYYKFVLGFGADVVCLVRYFREKHLPEDEKENLPEYTQLLAEDDQKTVLLMEAPMGYLIRYPPGQEEEIRLSGEEFIIGSLETGMDYRLPAQKTCEVYSGEWRSMGGRSEFYQWNKSQWKENQKTEIKGRR